MLQLLTEINSDVSQTLFSDDFDSAANWIAEPPWGLTSAVVHSGAFSFTDSPTADYANNVDTSLTLTHPVTLPLTEPVSLKFWTQFDLENGFDFGRVEISADGGPWTEIQTLTGIQSEWTEVTVPLAGVQGKDILVRFRLTTDFSITRDGWYIDDVRITTDPVNDLAKAAIDHLLVISGTSIGAGIQNADDELDRFPTDAARAMIVMTDGQHNTSPHPLDVINSQVDSDIRIFTIGFGSDADSTLLTQISDTRNGQFFFAASEGELTQIYAMLTGLVGGQQPVVNATGIVLAGQRTSTTFSVDPSVAQFNMTVNYPGSDLDLELIAPDGTLITRNTPAVNPNVRLLEGATFESFRVIAPLPGRWEVRVIAIDVPAEGEPFSLFATVDSSITANARTIGSGHQIGENVVIQVELRDNAPIVDAAVIASVTPPAGSPYANAQVVLYDDGLHDDGAADDGIYGNLFRRAVTPGNYTFQIDAIGFANAGFLFHRTPIALTLVQDGTDNDGDGLPDVWEDREGTDRNLNDATVDLDLDGLMNLHEFILGTQPVSADTDGDAFGDGAELIEQTDPLDALSFPVPAVPAPWQNAINRFDVDGQDYITARDALLIIADLRGNGIHPLLPPTPPSAPPPFLDVTGDNLVSPPDALQIIGFLRNRITGSGFVLNASAQLENDSLRLTNGFSQSSSIWFDQLLTATRFKASFDFEITDQGGSGWGDGFTFALVDAAVNDNQSVGAGGGELAYGGLSGLAIEFDTYQNFDDPPHVHVALNIGGSVVSTSVSEPLPFDIRDAGTISAEIIYDRGLLAVTLAKPNSPESYVLLTTVPDSLRPAVGRVGFTGATGSAFQTVFIDNVQIEVDSVRLISASFGPDSIPPGLSAAGEGEATVPQILPELQIAADGRTAVRSLEPANAGYELVHNAVYRFDIPGFTNYPTLQMRAIQPTVPSEELESVLSAIAEDVGRVWPDESLVPELFRKIIGQFGLTSSMP